MRRLVGAAVVGLLGWGLLSAGIGGSIACGSVPARVRGTVVDARTGAPVAGAAVRTPGGLARTDATGAFDAALELAVSYRTDWVGVVAGRTRESAFQAARSVRVERDGYEPIEHGTKGARWTEAEATLDVGVVRLVPR